MTDDGKINILIVDDKPEKLLSLEAILEELGQNIVRAPSGREALRCLLNQEFAVILLDVNMPGMDGFETAALIRQRPSTRDVPIIFITAMDDETHVSRGYSLGAVDYIQTPVVPEVLKTKISVFVDLFRKTEQVRRQATWLRQRAAQLHQLTAASLAINSALTTDQMLRIVTDTARDIIGAASARATLSSDHDQNRTTIVRCGSAAPDESAPHIGGLDHPEFQLMVCRMNRPIRMSGREMESHPAWQQMPENARQRLARGWLGVPLTGRDGHNLGLIEIWQKRAGEFTDDDEAVLIQLAQMASIAVENTLYAAERETNRIKDEFLSTLSHELRTPLNAILGWTQLLRIEDVDPEVAHGLEIIERNARAQTKLIEDLLDVSRITTGKLRLNRRPTLIGPVVEAALDAVRPIIETKNITLDYEATAANATVHADPDRLQQVFWNLLSNAAKFTDKNGRITVRLDRAPQGAQLIVSDTGQGIDPSFLPYVFDRFRQADSTSTRSHGGLGIGLMIVRHIIHLHGGSVGAQSPGAGHGATFTVTLPVSSPASLEAEKVLDSGKMLIDSTRDLQGLQILVVDDDPDAREFLCTVLRKAQASVVAASSVPTALQAFGRLRPDVVVSDIAMPEQDGFDLIRALRELPPQEGGEVPAVALTAYARPEDKIRAATAGFQLHLSKPVEPMELIAAVNQLSRSQPREHQCSQVEAIGGS